MADKYIKRRVKISYRYFISRNIKYSADKIKPLPKLKSTRQPIGYNSKINFQLNATPSIIQKRKRTATFIAKFIRDDTFLESKNIYFGTFILENIPALSCNDVIPVKVDSLK